MDEPEVPMEGGEDHSVKGLSITCYAILSEGIT
jgi:hypothetical protein